MKLLIVDDSSMIRRAITSAYKGTVFTEIQTASDGLLAVTLFKKLLPDVVTLDITMPHMDGLAALSQILEIKPKTNVLVVSALADHHTAIEALTRGADQFICKPFTEDDLKEALSDLTQPDRDTVQKEEKKLYKEQTKPSDNFERFQNKEKFSPMQHTAIFNDITTPTKKNHPSGYVKPPKIKPTVSLASYADEMVLKTAIKRED